MVQMERRARGCYGPRSIHIWIRLLSLGSKYTLAVALAETGTAVSRIARQKHKTALNDRSAICDRKG